MVRCEYCDQIMTSAPSHMEHRVVCAKSPDNRVKALELEVTALKKQQKSIRKLVDSASESMQGAAEVHEFILDLKNLLKQG